MWLRETRAPPVSISATENSSPAREHLSTAGGPPTEVGRGWSWGLPVPFPGVLHIHYHPLDVSQRMILTRQEPLFAPLFAHIPHARLHFLALL